MRDGFEYTVELSAVSAQRHGEILQRLPTHISIVCKIEARDSDVE